VTHVETCRASTEKISTESLTCDPPKSLFAPIHPTDMILRQWLPQTHRMASTIVSFRLGGSVQNARGAKKRVLGGNPDVRLYVVRAMPADSVPKAPIGIEETAIAHLTRFPPTSLAYRPAFGVRKIERVTQRGQCKLTVLQYVLRSTRSKNVWYLLNRNP
jgi:hypothetical protein